MMSTAGVLVRDRSNDPGCDGWVRITIGTREQMREAVGSAQRNCCSPANAARRLQ